MLGALSPHTPDRRRRGAAALLVAVLAGTAVAVGGSAQPAAAIPNCDVEDPPPICSPEEPPESDPVGALDTPTFGSGSVQVTGWATDPDTNGPINVVVTVDGASVGSATANIYRPGVGSHGFDITVPASASSSLVCVTGINVGPGYDADIGCAAFPYSTDVQVLDVCGAVSLPLSASLWRLSPPSGQAVQETTTSSGGRIGFASGRSLPGWSVGASLATSSLPGPLFRSGPMAALPLGSPANPSGRILVGVPCPTTFTTAQLNALLAGVPITPPAGVTITGVTLTTASGSMTLTVTGSATGTVSTWFGPISYTEPFTYALSFGLSPSTNMNNPAEIVVVNPTGPGTLTFTGGLGWLLNWLVVPQMEPAVTSSVVSSLQSGINGAIATAAAGSIPGGLPAGATISMARIVITPSGASFTPAVGQFA